MANPVSNLETLHQIAREFVMLNHESIFEQAVQFELAALWAALLVFFLLVIRWMLRDDLVLRSAHQSILDAESQYLPPALVQATHRYRLVTKRITTASQIVSVAFYSSLVALTATAGTSLILRAVL